MPRPLTPIFPKKIRYGKPVPFATYRSPATANPTDQRDTAAGAATFTPYNPFISEISDDFNRANEAAVTTPWTQTDPAGSVWGKYWGLDANKILHVFTTRDSIMMHNTSLSLGSTYVQITDMIYGTMLLLRIGGTQPFYTAMSAGSYRAGRLYYNSGSNDWRWAIIRNTTQVANFNQVPYVSPGTGCAVRLEVVEDGANVNVSLFVNDTLVGTYVDTSPLADTGRVAVYGNGRGGATPGFDNFDAGTRAP